MGVWYGGNPMTCLPEQQKEPRRRCGCCGRYLPLEAFDLYRKHKDGRLWRGWWCMECENTRNDLFWKLSELAHEGRASMKDGTIHCPACNHQKKYSDFIKNGRLLNTCTRCRTKRTEARKAQKERLKNGR